MPMHQCVGENDPNLCHCFAPRSPSETYVRGWSWMST